MITLLLLFLGIITFAFIVGKWGGIALSPYDED